MPILESNYKNPALLRNPHAHTVICAVARKRPKISYLRERLELADGDFVDLDWSTVESKKLLILTHGMEGSSKSKYILHSVAEANRRGYSAIAWNMRGCSGTPNRKLNFYHSGLTSDLEAVIRHAISCGYKEINLVGFSLGGNLTMLYLAQQGKKIPKSVRTGIAISAPVDLISSQGQIERRENRAYLLRFLKDFHVKFKTKRQVRGIYIDTRNFHRRTKTLAQLDARYTAPWNGFPNERAYYAECSSLPRLGEIAIPALLLNPEDDTFLSPECYPREFAAKSKRFYLEMPKQGGHCAMLTDIRLDRSYMERRIFEFIDMIQNPRK
jgi:uncharacterized protein